MGLISRLWGSKEDAAPPAPEQRAAVGAAGCVVGAHLTLCGLVFAALLLPEPWDDGALFLRAAPLDPPPLPPLAYASCAVRVCAADGNTTAAVAALPPGLVKEALRHRCAATVVTHRCSAPPPFSTDGALPSVAAAVGAPRQHHSGALALVVVTGLGGRGCRAASEAPSRVVVCAVDYVPELPPVAALDDGGATAALLAQSRRGWDYAAGPLQYVRKVLDVDLGDPGAAVAVPTEAALPPSPGDRRTGAQRVLQHPAWLPGPGLTLAPEHALLGAGHMIAPLALSATGVVIRTAVWVLRARKPKTD